MADLLDSVTVTASGGASSITFSSIGQNYKDLMIVGILKATVTSNAYTGAQIQINGSSSAIYDGQGIYIVGVPPSWIVYGDNYTNASNSAMSGYDTPTSNAANTEIFANMSWKFPNYTSTSYNKTVITDAGWWNGASSSAAAGNLCIANHSHSIRTTSAITSITVKFSSGNVAQYSQLSLYGL